MSRRVPLVAAALGLQLLLSIAAPARAHVALASSEPAAGTTVAGLDAVTLVFTEALRQGGSSFTLVGPGGDTVGTGGVTGPRRMTLDALGDVPPGEYRVKWTAAGTDGHIERGTFTFTVAAAATSEPATAAVDAGTPAVEPATPSPVAPATPSTVPSPGPSDGPTGAPSTTSAPASETGGDVLVPLAGGLAIVIVVGLLVLRRSRRP